MDYSAKLQRDERGLMSTDRAVMNLLLNGKSRADICGELNSLITTRRMSRSTRPTRFAGPAARESSPAGRAI